MPHSLTAEEIDILARLDDKERIVRSRIRTIALPTYTGVRGFFVDGPPGHGKTSLVRSELDDVYGPDKWLLYNSDMSPPALWQKWNHTARWLLSSRTASNSSITSRFGEFCGVPWLRPTG